MRDPATASLDRLGGQAAPAGLIVGVLVSAGVAIVGRLDESWSLAVALGLLGIPSAAILGWRYGPKVGGASFGDAALIVVKMGALAAFGSAFVIGSVASIGAVVYGGLGGLSVVAFALLYGIPVVMITIPAALAWTVLMRLLTCR
jgi:hypothetical protein